MYQSQNFARPSEVYAQGDPGFVQPLGNTPGAPGFVQPLGMYSPGAQDVAKSLKVNTLENNIPSYMGLVGVLVVIGLTLAMLTLVKPATSEQVTLIPADVSGSQVHFAKSLTVDSTINIDQHGIVDGNGAVHDQSATLTTLQVAQQCAIGTTMWTESSLSRLKLNSEAMQSVKLTLLKSIKFTIYSQGVNSFLTITYKELSQSYFSCTGTGSLLNTFKLQYMTDSGITSLFNLPVNIGVYAYSFNATIIPLSSTSGKVSIGPVLCTFDKTLGFPDSVEYNPNIISGKEYAKMLTTQTVPPAYVINTSWNLSASGIFTPQNPQLGFMLMALYNGNVDEDEAWSITEMTVRLFKIL